MLAALDAEVLRHGHHQRIALHRAHHRQADAGVAAGGLDHRLPRAQRAAPLGVLDDPEREPVLDRAHRVERLDLDVEVDVRRRELVQPHDRRAADRARGCCRTSGASHAARRASRAAPGALRTAQASPRSWCSAFAAATNRTKPARNSCSCARTLSSTRCPRHRTRHPRATPAGARQTRCAHAACAAPATTRPATGSCRSRRARRPSPRPGDHRTPVESRGRARQPVDGVLEHAGDAVVVFGRGQQQAIARQHLPFELLGRRWQAFGRLDVAVVQRDAADRRQFQRRVGSISSTAARSSALLYEPARRLPEMPRIRSMGRLLLSAGSAMLAGRRVGRHSPKGSGGHPSARGCLRPGRPGTGPAPG